MDVKKKNISIINNILSGIVIIILGLIIIIGNLKIYTKLVNLLVYVFFLFTLSKLLNFSLNRKIVRNKQTLISIIINIILGLVLIIFPKVSLSILPIIFSIYLLLYSIINFIDYSINRINNLNIRFKYLILSAIFLLFSITFMFYPLNRIDLFIFIIGIYCLILGLSKIIEFVVDLFTDKFKIKIRRKIIVTLPAIIEAFVPKKNLLVINKYFDSIIVDAKKEEPSDLQIFIHLSNYGFNQFGHMDICFLDKVYSYGNYDNKSKKVFNAVGEGVLFALSNKQKYIKFCIDTSKKTIVEFGLKLTELQKNNVMEELNKIFNNAYVWDPIKENINKKDYVYKLYNNTKCKFYKFIKGQYKIYFLMGVNCTYFIDSILKKSLSNTLKLVGVISLGTYYNYLDEIYHKKNSIVVSKKIYRKEMFGDVDAKNKK